MSGTLIALFLGAGVAGWVYNHFYKTTGGNAKTAGGVAAAAGVVGFIITLVAWNMINH